MNEKGLEIIRKQVHLMWEFIERTPDFGKPHRNAVWWAGNFPAHIDLYGPADWEKSNRPLVEIWEDYLAELEQFDPARVRRARELPIADALELAKAWED